MLNKLKIVHTEDGIKLQNHYPRIFKIVMTALLGIPVWLIVASSENSWVHFVLLILILLVWGMFMTARAYIVVKRNEGFRYGIFPLLRRNRRVDDIVGIRAVAIPSSQRINRDWGGRGNETFEDGYLVDCGASTRAVQIELEGGRRIRLGWGNDDRQVHEAANQLIAALQNTPQVD